MKIVYLSLALVVLSFVSIFIGVSDLGPLDLFSLNDMQTKILFISRIPRLVSTIIAGASISICGLIMQQLTQNKFVSPTTAGTMDSAGLGVVVSLVVFTSASPLVKMSVAFIFALFGTLIFMKILDVVKFKDTIFIPLVGLMFGSIVSSITTFFAYKYNLIQSVSTWLHGDFSTIIAGQYELIYISIPLVGIAYLFANGFTVAGMGEDFSINLGLKYKQVVYIGLIIVALVTSSVILTVGMIPFLGLIVPNLVSIYKGDHLKSILPHTALLGTVLVLACDIFGRLVVFPYEISVGLIFGVIGSGLFIYLLLRRKKVYG